VQEAVDTLNEEISRMITPALDVEIDTLESQGKQIIRIQVPAGDDRPYAIEDYKIYVRDDTETNLAVRDEIVNLVMQGQLNQPLSAPPANEETGNAAEVAASLAEPDSTSLS